MRHSVSISPVVATGLAVVSALVLSASVVLFGIVALIVIMVLAIVDGRPKTAAALCIGWAIAAAGALLSLHLSSLELPPGVESLAGLAFVVFPLLLAVLTLATGAAFASAHFVRKRIVRSPQRRRDAPRR
jgi:hypothetical protein